MQTAIGNGRIVLVKSIDNMSCRKICLGYPDRDGKWMVHPLGMGWKSVSENYIEEIRVGQLRTWRDEIGELAGVSFEIVEVTNVPNTIVEYCKIKYEGKADLSFESISAILSKSDVVNTRHR